jgi:hypothetical protein
MRSALSAQRLTDSSAGAPRGESDAEPTSESVAQRLQGWAGGGDGGQPGPPWRRYVAAAVGILVLATLLSLLMRP